MILFRELNTFGGWMSVPLSCQFMFVFLKPTLLQLTLLDRFSNIFIAWLGREALAVLLSGNVVDSFCQLGYSLTS